MSSSFKSRISYNFNSSLTQLYREIRQCRVPARLDTNQARVGFLGTDVSVRLRRDLI